MIPTLHPLANILLLSLVASLGTGLGGVIAVMRRPGRRMYGLLMGVTAGVMLCLSFLELVDQAWQLAGWETATIGFGLGAITMFLLDQFSPHIRFGEQEIRGADPCEPCVEGIEPPARLSLGMQRKGGQTLDRRLISTGVLLAVGITLHNLPEGIAVGAGYMHNPQFGLFIAAAIMLHNIPEGIATALPLCKGGVRRRDALRVSFLSGMAEPLGALVASLFLVAFGALVPYALAFAGGVMVFITLDELIPTAREYGHNHYSAAGIIIGSMFVFILSGLFGV